MMDLFNFKMNKSDSPRKKEGLALIEVNAYLTVKTQKDYFVVTYVFLQKTHRRHEMLSHLKRTYYKCYFIQK